MFQYEDLQKTIFDFSYGGALGDAIGQRAFEGNKKPLRRHEDAKKIARAYIDQLMAGEEPDFYKTAEALEASFQQYIRKHKADIVYEKDGKPSDPIFRFGNAQKLLNMLAKNMFLLAYRDESLRDKFVNCHCPMDNIMIDTVKKELKQLGDEKAKELLRAYNASGKAAWSRIEKENVTQYECFQACVRYLAKQEGLSPIEYDYWMWKKASPEDEVSQDAPV